jgi:hypothetical protein
MTTEELDRLRALAIQANAAYEAYENVDSAIYELSKVAEEVEKVMALHLSAEAIVLLRQVSRLSEALTAAVSEIEGEMHRACFDYAHALTGLNIGDVVQVRYPNGKEFMMRVDSVSCYLGDEEDLVSFYGKRIRKSDRSVGVSTDSWTLGSAEWKRVEMNRLKNKDRDKPKRDG